jgi:predicted transcriptional regulator of viral defense system
LSLPLRVAKNIAKCHTFAMPGRVYEALHDIATGTYGYLTPADARAIGVAPARLVEMKARGHLEQIDHGLYRMRAIPATALDQLMEATLWPRALGVLSHDTALDLHDLCDVNPARVHVTVPRAYRVRRAVPPVYALHRRDLDEADAMRHEGIPVVTPYRAILDGIERDLGGGLIDQAIETARRRGQITEAQRAELERPRLEREIAGSRA